MSSRLLTTTVLAAALLSSAVGANAAELSFDDFVGTLNLSQELDGRGSLGGITVDQLGYLYVANFRDAVWRISPEGEVTELSRSLYGSSGNAVDSRGDLFQANFFGNTIHKIARTGEETRFVSEDLNGPVGIAVGEDDTLYVCNCSGNFIAQVSPTGEVSRLAEGDLFACPNGIVFGPDEQLYVTNFNNHDIIQISTQGAASKFALVPGGAGNAYITYAKGFFFVTKVFANTVSKIGLDGEVFQVAGTGQAGHTDGPADTATLAHPNGITVSPTGDMLFVNTLVGDFRSSGPTQMTIRTVEFTTMTKVLDAAQAEGGIEEMAVSYKAYSEDPIRGREDTVAEMIAYGYRHLSGGQTPEALEIFRLNAEGHPDDPGALFQFGEFYRYTGQNEAAVEQYRRTLEIDPEHAQASARLAQLGADQD